MNPFIEMNEEKKKKKKRKGRRRKREERKRIWKVDNNYWLARLGSLRDPPDLEDRRPRRALLLR